MPVLNGEKYLKEAIESILHQTFSDFEFIIINDGSTDSTEAIIKSFSDPRIVYIKNEANLGLSKSFNIGIAAARGEYIARMDADDMSISERFEKQLSYLEVHPDISVLGTAVILMNERGLSLKKASKYTSHVEIKWQSLFSTPLFHPTVMARAKILKDNRYDESFYNSEDYELWSRLLFTTSTRFANLTEPLLYYRVFPTSFTQKLKDEKRIVSAENSIRNIERYITLNEPEKEVLIELRQEKPLTASDLKMVWNLYMRAVGAFCRTEQPRLNGLFIYTKLLSLAIFLFKHKLKHYLSPA